MKVGVRSCAGSPHCTSVDLSYMYIDVTYDTSAPAMFQRRERVP